MADQVERDVNGRMKEIEDAYSRGGDEKGLGVLLSTIEDLLVRLAYLEDRVELLEDTED